jgi:hypothetical protein
MEVPCLTRVLFNRGHHTSAKSGKCTTCKTSQGEFSSPQQKSESSAAAAVVTAALIPSPACHHLRCLPHLLRRVHGTRKVAERVLMAALVARTLWRPCAQRTGQRRQGPRVRVCYYARVIVNQHRVEDQVRPRSAFTVSRVEGPVAPPTLSGSHPPDARSTLPTARPTTLSQHN